MFSFDKSFYIYVLIVTLFLLIGLHFWRKIHNMKSHCKIMENKLKTLKRENSELQKALSEDSMEKTTMSEADVAMNHIFNVESKDIPQMMQAELFFCSEGKCDIRNMVDVSEAAMDVSEAAMDVSEAQSVTTPEPVVENMIEEIIEEVVMPVSDEIPVAKHENVVDNIESESVVSENSNVYNRKKLSKLNLEKLKEIAVSMKLPTDGTKNMIIDRILSQ